MFHFVSSDDMQDTQIKKIEEIRTREDFHLPPLVAPIGNSKNHKCSHEWFSNQPDQIFPQALVATGQYPPPQQLDGPNDANEKRNTWQNDLQLEKNRS